MPKWLTHWAKSLILGGIISIFSQPAFANSEPSEEPLTVLFYELKPMGGISPQKVRLLENVVVGELHNYKQFNVLSGNDVKRLIDTDGLKQALDCNSTSCMLDIAGALGTALIIGGDVGYMDETTAVLSLQIIRTHDSKVLSRVTSSLTGKGSELIPQTKKSVVELLSGYDPNYTVASNLTSPPPPSADSVQREDGSILNTWWFWTGVGAVALGAGAFVLLQSSGDDAKQPAEGTWTGTFEVDNGE